MSEHNATLIYTAELLHPSDPERTIMELDVSVEIEWREGWEKHFWIGDIYYVEDVYRNGVDMRKHHPLPSEVQAWVRSCIEQDRAWVAKGIDDGVEDGMVTASRPDTGGRLSDPF